MMTEQTAQTFLLSLQSGTYSQSILHDCYTKLNVDDPVGKSYANSPTFMYELNHGLELLKQGNCLPYTMQPILYYYGLIHLLKASLRLIRPDYPEKTSQLAHGISARKKRRQNYTFLEDEVNIQLHGLFPYCAEHLFGIEQFSTRKLKMKDLLHLIPEVSGLFHFQNDSTLIKVGNSKDSLLTFPSDILDQHHMSKARFIGDIENKLKAKAMQSSDKLQFQLTEPIDDSVMPFRLSASGDIYFPTCKRDVNTLPDLLIYYGLLYNLSMLARYEAEWWGELFALKQDSDYPIIIHFLRTSVQNIPTHIAKFIKMYIEK